MARLIRTLRWFSRITGLLLAGLIVLFAIGNGFNTRQVTLTTGLMSVAFCAAAAGMLILWRWELIGGMIVLVGMTAFYVIKFTASGKWPGGWFFPLCFLPGVLALMCSGLTRRMEKA
jgi:hypothetical protein